VLARLLHKHLRALKSTKLGDNRIEYKIKCSNRPSVETNLHLKVDVSNAVTPYNYANDRNHTETRLERT
jgi:hypothetical protein